MYYPVTVDKALKRGQLTVNLPVMFIMFGGWAFVAYLGAKQIINPAFILVGVFLGIIIAYVYWSVMITRWRLWAFENVRNVHELKRRAIRGQLIWPDGSFFKRTEIRTPSQKSKWLLLQDRFNQKDIFEEDHTVDVVKTISYSKNKAGYAMLFGLVPVGLGVYLYYEGQELIIVAGSVLVGFYMLIVSYRRYINREPQIILSNDGVETANTPFYSWAEIADMDTMLERNSGDEGASVFFIYNCPSGEVKIEISELNISRSDLDNLIGIYKGRYEKKQLRR